MSWIALQVAPAQIEDWLTTRQRDPTSNIREVLPGADRYFISIAEDPSRKMRHTSVDAFLAQLRQELTRRKISPYRLGVGNSAASALLDALEPGKDDSHWSVSWAFDYFFPFDIDRDFASEQLVINWLKGESIHTIAELRERLQFPLPRPFKFLSTLMMEADRSATPEGQVKSKRSEEKNVEPERYFRGGPCAINKIQKRLGREHVFIMTPAAPEAPDGSFLRRDYSASTMIPGSFLSGLDLELGTASSVAPPAPDLRPSRLLPIPIPISHFENKLHAAHQRWHCARWGAAQPFCGIGASERHYYTVETIEGDALWIYREVQSGRLYLHGTFD